ncbi:MAG: CBS domain-containing protein [Proteobacteria bacterium]|nr:CBS domain-containing protein [Pseudomonadota bacterium]
MSDNFGIIDNRFLAKSLGILHPHHPISVPDHTAIKDVILLLQQHKIGCVILTDIAGHLTGIFTERDVLLKVMLKDLRINVDPVSHIMTAKPQTASMTTTIAFALNMMSDGGFRHIPIVDDENFPVGIISIKNIVDYIAKATVSDLIQFN